MTLSLRSLPLPPESITNAKRTPPFLPTSWTAAATLLAYSSCHTWYIPSCSRCVRSPTDFQIACSVLLTATLCCCCDNKKTPHTEDVPSSEHLIKHMAVVCSALRCFEVADSRCASRDSIMRSISVGVCVGVQR